MYASAITRICKKKLTGIIAQQTDYQCIDARWVADPSDPARPAGVHGGSYQTPSEAASCDLLEDLPADAQSPAVGFRCCGQAKLFQQSEYAEPE